ncbi:Gfo/Idh/MocA family oxidoreductase [Fimbriimonas ginsengisoli]|uniref:Putative oxidoreductase n=1 Tax=Fimbriimonas ginsengisoli Gsoil 348 TaxID=661478 RepID=A0A068NPM0_FIMGI|nr:Gfo/Idh/MocA family oxidoreductase [Fimbriimonas ginsengisoli]AIE85493.1 putative oxidoreductase [Fimbriimonas ginsengisoli Gsoil 348]
MTSPRAAGLTFAIAGAGGRGRMFAQWLHDNLGPGVVVAVADPRAHARQAVVEMHGVPEAGRFETWQDLLAKGRVADVLINTTMDREHVGSACEAMRLGYHMLLEKPLATTLEHAREIDRVRRETGRIVSVCHSLRYHSVYERVREIIDSGAIGDIVSLDQLEAVEHIHQSHSFVRGNWGNTARSTFMLLAKSCHDIDIIASLVDRPCRRVGSFGALTHFRTEQAPAGAPEYCVDGCPVAETCPYHSMKVYGADTPWRSHAGFDGLTREQTLLRLRESPYGRCVYRTDNDVVDHQVVNIDFEGDVTATFTMTAFTPWGGRYLRIHGTRGYLEAKIDQRSVDLWEFWRENRHSRFEVPEEAGAHGGADGRLMKNFLEAVLQGDPSKVRTGTEESLRTHTIAFAAETARRDGVVVDVAAMSAELREPAQVS